MPCARGLCLLSLLAGVGLLGYAGLQGQLALHFVVVIPVVTGTGPWAVVGGLFLVGGVVGWFLTSPNARRATSTRHRPDRHPPSGSSDAQNDRAPDEPEAGAREGNHGGILLLGPIPILWGSDRETVWLLALAGLGLTLAATVLFVWL